MYQNKYTSQQIIEHLQDSGFNLSNDKVLREPQKNREYINKAYFHLAQSFKTNDFQQDAIMAQTIPGDRHIESANFLKKLRLLREVSATDFSLANLLKPDREKTLKNFNLLMNSRTFIDRAKEKDAKLVSLERQLQELQTKKVTELKGLVNEEQAVKLKKQAERPAYQEKIEMIHNIESQIIYKVKQRNDLDLIKKELTAQFQRKQNALQLANTQKKHLELQFQKKHKELINGTPQLKLAKIQIAEKIEKMRKHRDLTQSIINQKLIYTQKFQPQFYKIYDEVVKKTDSANQLVEIYERTVGEKNHSVNNQNKLNQRIKQLKNQQHLKTAEISKLSIQITKTQQDKSELKKRLLQETVKQERLKQENEEQRNISEKIMTTHEKFSEVCSKFQNTIRKMRTDFTQQYEQVRRVRKAMQSRNDEVQKRMFAEFEEVLKQLKKPIDYDNK